MQMMFLDRMETAAMLNVSLRTVDRMLKNGDIAHVKTPTGLVRISVESINEMIAKHTKHANKEGRVK